MSAPLQNVKHCLGFMYKCLVAPLFIFCSTSRPRCTAMELTKPGTNLTHTLSKITAHAECPLKAHYNNHKLFQQLHCINTQHSQNSNTIMPSLNLVFNVDVMLFWEIFLKGCTQCNTKTQN